MKKKLDSVGERCEEKSLVKKVGGSPGVLATVFSVGAAVFMCMGDKMAKVDDDGAAAVVTPSKAKDDGVETGLLSMKFTDPELRRLKTLPEYSFTPTVSADNPEFESKLKEGTDMPKGISEEEIKKVSVRFAEIVEKDMNTNLSPNLSNNRVSNDEFLGKYIMGLVTKLEGLDPKAATDVAELKKAKNVDLSNLIPKYNRYLIRAGYFMEVNNYGPYDVKFDLFKIEGVRTVKVSDGELSMDIPLFEVGKSIGPKQISAMDAGMIATCDSTFTKMVLYKENVDSGAARMVQRMSMFGGDLSASERKLLAEKVVDDYLRHEATHAYLANKFPHAGTMLTKGVNVKQPVVIKVGEGELRLGNQFPPVMFHELCGIGMQMARSEIPYPNVQVTYSGAVARPGDPYALTYSLMPLVSLMAVKDGREKDVLQMGLVGSGNLDLQNLFRLMSKQSNPVAYNHETGRILYTLGYRVLEKAEREMVR